MYRSQQRAEMILDLTTHLVAGALVVETTPTILPGYTFETLSDSGIAALAAPGLPPLDGSLRTLAAPLQWSPTQRLYLPPQDGAQLVLPAATPTAPRNLLSHPDGMARRLTEGETPWTP